MNPVYMSLGVNPIKNTVIILGFNDKPDVARREGTIRGLSEECTEIEIFNMMQGHVKLRAQLIGWFKILGFSDLDAAIQVKVIGEVLVNSIFKA